MLAYRFYHSHVSTLFLLRFITILTHLVILILIFTDRDSNVKASLPRQYAATEYTSVDTSLLVWLGLSAGFLFLELVSLLLTVTSFAVYQSFISIVTHAIAVFSLFPYYVDSWPSAQIQWIFGFCTVMPCITEMLVYVDMFGFKKTFP